MCCVHCFNVSIYFQIVVFLILLERIDLFFILYARFLSGLSKNVLPTVHFYRNEVNVKMANKKVHAIVENEIKNHPIQEWVGQIRSFQNFVQEKAFWVIWIVRHCAEIEMAAPCNEIFLFSSYCKINQMGVKMVKGKSGFRMLYGFRK